MTKQIITPHLWYDKEAKEASDFYISAFGQNSKIKHITTIHDTPSGSADIVAFDIFDYQFMAISAGPQFKINPSISFHVKCKEVAEVDEIWHKLSPGGTTLMELGEYPFSKRFGWLQDKYGVTWQVIHIDDDFRQRIMPVLMFTQDICGLAEEAVNYYASVFPGASVQFFDRYRADEEPEKEGTIRYAQFILGGQEFGAMDSAQAHDFKFNEAVSLIVNCKDQAEIDYYWDKLSAVPEAEQCGWVKDQFGVSWQIVPANLDELMGRNAEKTTPVLLEMKKIIIAELEKAGE